LFEPLSIYRNVQLVFLGLGALITAPFVFTRIRLAAAGVYIVYVLLLYVEVAVDLVPTKPFTRFYEAIRIGTSEDEVTSVLQREFPVGGRFHVPEMNRGDGGVCYILDPTNADYNAEAVCLDIAGGRVTAKSYD